MKNSNSEKRLNLLRNRTFQEDKQTFKVHPPSQKSAVEDDMFSDDKSQTSIIKIEQSSGEHEKQQPKKLLELRKVASVQHHLMFKRSSTHVVNDFNRVRSHQALIQQLSQPNNELVQFAQKLIEMKAQATQFYENELYEQARNSFENCLQIFNELQSLDSLFVTNIFSMFRECHINLALCYVRLNMFQNAVEILTSVISYSPNCVQAFYLRGKAFQCLDENEMALLDLKRTKEILLEENNLNELTQVEDMIVQLQSTKNCAKQTKYTVTTKKQLNEQLNIEVPTTFEFFKICFKLMKRSVWSKNGVFNALIAGLLYYFVVHKKCINKLLWIAYRQIVKMEKQHLNRLKRL